MPLYKRKPNRALNALVYKILGALFCGSITIAELCVLISTKIQSAIVAIIVFLSLTVYFIASIVQGLKKSKTYSDKKE